MSIYSGFATRQIEQTYNIMVEQLFRVLQKRILKFYRNEVVNESVFIDCIKKLLTQMSFFERQKHLPPKFSDNCKELAAFLKLTIPSNVSLIGTKKSKEVSQKHFSNRNEMEDTKSTLIDQHQQMQQQKIENAIVHYGEPQKSEINIQKIHHQHSLFSTNSTQLNQPDQMQISQENDNSIKFRENKQNFITLEAAYNNSSSSISPNASMHSSLASLSKKNVQNNKLDSKKQNDQNIKRNSYNEYNPQKNEAQVNLVKQIVQGQKKVIQSINKQNLIQDNSNSEDIKKGAIKHFEKQDVSQKYQQENQQQQSTDFNINSLRQFRVFKKQQQQVQENEFGSLNKSIQPNSQGHSPSKAGYTENNIISNNDFQTIVDDIQLLPHMNKKKNRRSHTTKRQRKRNLILNNIYLNGEEQQISVQNGSQTAIIQNLNSIRSRSSHRSSEQPQRNILFNKQIIENNLVRSDSMDKSSNYTIQVRQNTNNDRQLGTNKMNRNSNFNTQDSNNKSTYNPIIASNNSKQVASSNFKDQVLKKQDSDGQIGQNFQQPSQHNPLSTPSDLTMYSIRQQIVEQMTKVNSGTVQTNNNQSMMIESGNSLLSRQKHDLFTIQNDNDDEPQFSRVNTSSNSLQNKFVDPNSNYELKNMLNPFSGNNTTKNRTPQKHRILQNSSLNNSLQNTQNTFKHNNQSISDSSQFDQMYKNQSKKQSSSHLYSQHFTKQIPSQNSSNKKFSTIDSSNVVKTSITALDQSTCDEQLKNNSSFNSSNINKKETISPQKKKIQYKFIVNKPQQISQQRNASPSNLQKENKAPIFTKLNQGQDKKLLEK